MSRSYRPAKQSARRRRLALTLMNQAESATPANERSAEQSAVAAELSRAISGSEPTVPPGFDEMPDALHELLSSDEPIHWLLLGEAYHDGSVPPESRLPMLFDRLLEGPMARQYDSIVDLRFNDADIVAIAKSYADEMPFPERTVANVMMGHSDARFGVSRCEDYETKLISLLRQLHRHGMTILLNTPPCLPETDDNLIVDRLVYLEAMRSCAAEEDVSIVDHWAYWEWVAIEMGGMASWYDETGIVPGRTGIRQMVDLIAKECVPLTNAVQ